MKKQLINASIGLFLILTSCSSNDDNNSNTSIQINPPTWIQGTWLESIDPDIGWRFTNNDIISIIGNVEMSQKEQLELGANNGQDVSVEEDSTSEYYSVQLNYPAGQTVNYYFEKLSETQIRLSPAIYTKQ